MAESVDREKYTVGWIAPLALELAAATPTLEEHTTLPVSEDGTLYHVGRIGDHYVAMVVCPRMGTNPAATTATHMRRSFPNIKHMLVVGIAGGMPRYGLDEEKQIVLGDVVVGVPQDREAGVTHYEYGALLGDGTLRVSGHVLHPSSELLIAVNNLRIAHMHQPGTRIPQYLPEMRKKITKLELPEFKNPGSDLDRLFDDDYAHVDRTKSCTVLCDASRSTLRKDRGPRAVRKKDTPTVHYGTIGSANTLVISSMKRNELYREHGTIAFEMESAGVVSDIQALVIRGICDYADSHKNKMWQKYAASTAAACAKEILLLLPAARSTGRGGAGDLGRDGPVESPSIGGARVGSGGANIVGN